MVDCRRSDHGIRRVVHVDVDVALLLDYVRRRLRRFLVLVFDCRDHWAVRSGGGCLLLLVRFLDNDPFLKRRVVV